MLVLTPGGEISTVDVPDMLPPMLRSFCRSAIEENPSDLPRFAANYFANLAALSAPPSFREDTPSTQDSVLRDRPAGSTAAETTNQDSYPASSGLPAACRRCGAPCSSCREAAGITGGDLDTAIGNGDAPSGESRGHSGEPSKHHQPAGSCIHVHAIDGKKQEANGQGFPERISIEPLNEQLDSSAVLPAAEADEADLAAHEGQSLAFAETGEPFAAKDSVGGASSLHEMSPADDTDGQQLLDTAECEGTPDVTQPIPLHQPCVVGFGCFQI